MNKLTINIDLNENMLNNPFKMEKAFTKLMHDIENQLKVGYLFNSQGECIGTWELKA